MSDAHLLEDRDRGDTEKKKKSHGEHCAAGSGGDSGHVVCSLWALGPRYLGAIANML
jgi:hypothetical protein